MQVKKPQPTNQQKLLVMTSHSTCILGKREKKKKCVYRNLEKEKQVMGHDFEQILSRNQINI